MNYLVIYPGRFHPFHLGHKASYDYLADKYGAENVYIVTSDKQAPVSSPFSYPDKVEMMTKLGVPASHIVKVKNPYQATEITDNLTPEQRADTALIFAVSAKDAERFNFKPKRDGSPSYIQPLPKSGKKLQPMTKSAYVDITPTVNFKVRGQDANSASAIRQMFVDGNDADRDQIITDLYGAPDSSLRDMFKKKLGITDHVVRMMQECRRLGTARSLALMERVIRAERAVLQEFAPGPERDGGDDDDNASEYSAWHKKLFPMAQKYYQAMQNDDYDLMGKIESIVDTWKAKDSSGTLQSWTIGPEEGSYDEGDGVQCVLDGEYGNSSSISWPPGQLEGLSENLAVEHPDQDESADYIEEKWSAKYKRSINCAHPKGFSQRAHCAGRKK